MRLAASLSATSSSVVSGLAVVTALPFCLSIAATFIWLLPSAQPCERATAPGVFGRLSVVRNPPAGYSRGLAHRL